MWRPRGARRWPGYGYEYRAAPTREQELDFLKREDQALRDHIKELETEIGRLSAEQQ